jgi:hypothetical protein
MFFLHAQFESNQNQINHVGIVCRFGQKLSHACQKQIDDSQTSVTFWLTHSETSMSNVKYCQLSLYLSGMIMYHMTFNSLHEGLVHKICVGCVHTIPA